MKKLFLVLPVLLVGCAYEGHSYLPYGVNVTPTPHYYPSNTYYNTKPKPYYNQPKPYYNNQYYYDKHDHHDHGKHKGHNKHKHHDD